VLPVVVRGCVAPAGGDGSPGDQGVTRTSRRSCGFAVEAVEFIGCDECSANLS